MTWVTKFGFLLALAVLTFERNAIWLDEQSLRSDNIVKSSQKDRAWFELGKAYERSLEWNKALMMYYNAGALNMKTRDTYLAHCAIGKIYLLQFRDKERAYEQFMAASAIDAKSPEARLYLQYVGYIDRVQGADGAKK